MTASSSDFRSGQARSHRRSAPSSAVSAFDPDAWDRVILGFPVWAANVAPPIRTFVRDQDLRGKRIAAFACQTAAGADKAFVKLKGELGLDALEAELTLLDPKTKPNPENEQKIRDFCAALKG